MALITASKKRRVTFDLPDSDSEDSDSEENENSLLLLRKQFYYSKKRSATTRRQKRDPASAQPEVKLKSILKNANYEPCVVFPVTSSFLPVEVVNAIINSKLGSHLFDQVPSDLEDKSCESPNSVFGKCNNANDSLNTSFDSEETAQENQETTNSTTDFSTESVVECKSPKNRDVSGGFFDFWSISDTDSGTPVKVGNFDSDAEDCTEELTNKNKSSTLNSNKGVTTFSIQSSRGKKESINNTRKFTNSCFNNNLPPNTQSNNLKALNDKPIKKVLARISNSEAFKEVTELKPIQNLSKVNNSIFSKDLENKRKENKFVNKKCSEDSNNNLELLENPLYKKLKTRTNFNKNIDCKGDDNLITVLERNSNNKRKNSADFGKVLEGKSSDSEREVSEIVSKESITTSDNNFSNLETFSDNFNGKSTDSDNTNSKLSNLETNCDNLEKKSKNCFDFWDLIQSNSPVLSKTGEFDSDAEECQEEEISRRNTHLQSVEQVLAANEISSRVADYNCLISEEAQPNSITFEEKQQKSASISEVSKTENKNCIEFDKQSLDKELEYKSNVAEPANISTDVKNQGESTSDVDQASSESINCDFRHKDSESNCINRFESQSLSHRHSLTDSCDSGSDTSITESRNRKRNKFLKRISKNCSNPAEGDCETLATDSINSESKKTDNKKLVNPSENNKLLGNVSEYFDKRQEHNIESSESGLRTNNRSENSRADSDFDFWSIIESDSVTPIKAGDFDSDADDFVEEDSSQESYLGDFSDLSEDSNESSPVSRKSFQTNNISNRKTKRLKKVLSKNFSKDSINKRKEDNLVKDAQEGSSERVNIISASEINLLDYIFIENLETNPNYFSPEIITKASFIELSEALISSHPALLTSQEDFDTDKFTLDENSNIKNCHIKDLTARENVRLEELPDYKSSISNPVDSHTYPEDTPTYPEDTPTYPEDSPCLPVEAPFEFETDLTIPVYENLINEFAASGKAAKSLKSAKSRHSRHRSKSASRTSVNYPDTVTTCKPNLLITLNLASFGSRIYSELPDSPLSPSKRVIRPYTRKAPVKRTPSPTSPTPPNMGSENLYGLNCAGEAEILSPSKRDDIKEKDILIWIYNMIDEPARVDYEFFLKDGCILCKIMNRVKPGCIPEDEITWEGSRSKQKNVSNFLEQAEKYGVPKAKLFFPEDLLHLRHVPRVTRCLFALAKIAQDDPALGPDCPRIGDEPNFVDAAKKVLIPGHRDTKDVMNQLATTIAKKDEKKVIKVSLYK